MLGTAENITIDKDNTTIVNGAGDAENIKARVNQSNRKLKQQLLITIEKNCKNV